MPRFIHELIRISLPVVIIAAGIAGFAAIGQRKQAPSDAEKGDKAPLVDYVPIENHADSITIELDGLVVPYREISLAAEVSGRITYKAKECRAGEYVKANTRLFEVDPELYKLEIERLEAEKLQADGNLQELHVEISNTKRLIEIARRNVALEEKKIARTKQLYSRGVATESDLDQGLQNELTARNNLVTLENQATLAEKRVARLNQSVKVIDARLRQAKRDFKHTTIVAPVDGVVVSDAVELDGFVQQGTQLVVIEDTSAVEVRCNLKMDELGWLFDTQNVAKAEPANPISPEYELPEVPVTVSYQLGTHRYDWQGHVARFDGVGLDQKTRTIPCRIEVPRPREFRVDGETAIQKSRGPRTLMRGMFVSITAHVWPKTPLLAIPELALKPGNKVWQVQEGTLQIVPVDVLWRESGHALIAATTSRLKAGDPLVVSPLTNPQTGTQVTIRKAQTP